MNYLKSKTCNKWFENCRRQHRPWARCCRAVLLTWEEVHQTRGLHRGAGETRPGEARRPYWWETNKKTDGKIFFSIRFRWFFLINVGNFIFQKKKIWRWAAPQAPFDFVSSFTFFLFGLKSSETYAKKNLTICSFWSCLQMVN